MPSSRLSDESVLLTPTGWRIASTLPTQCEMVGIDRHGKAISTQTTVTSVDRPSRLAFVGTTSAFGGFVGATRLTASDGKKWLVRDLVESSNVADVYFETLVRLPGVVTPTPIADELWGRFGRVAAITNNDSIAFRCRDPIIALSASPQFPVVKQVSDWAIAIVRRQELERELASDWPNAITSLATCWLKNRDDDRLEIERTNYFLALWCAVAMMESKLGYGFQYDTLQHSSYVFVAESNAAPRPLQRGACAFYSTQQTQEYLLAWDDTSFAPISAGFLLAAD